MNNIKPNKTNGFATGTTFNVYFGVLNTNEDVNYILFFSVPLSCSLNQLLPSLLRN